MRKLFFLDCLTTLVEASAALWAPAPILLMQAQLAVAAQRCLVSGVVVNSADQIRLLQRLWRETTHTRLDSCLVGRDHELEITSIVFSIRFRHSTSCMLTGLWPRIF